MGEDVMICCRRCNYDTWNLRTGKCSYCTPLPTPDEQNDIRVLRHLLDEDAPSKLKTGSLRLEEGRVHSRDV